mmetsp:Transcript_9314/g.26484  ORF Transcript_9314/g.26484 Transcript_9314/m.26484 type:complete len:288 (-) Transcript_9314:749-1612(-)
MLFRVLEEFLLENDVLLETLGDFVALFLLLAKCFPQGSNLVVLLLDLRGQAARQIRDELVLHLALFRFAFEQGPQLARARGPVLQPPRCLFLLQLKLHHPVHHDHVGARAQLQLERAAVTKHALDLLVRRGLLLQCVFVANNRAISPFPRVVQRVPAVLSARAQRRRVPREVLLRTVGRGIVRGGHGELLLFLGDERNQVVHLLRVVSAPLLNRATIHTVPLHLLALQASITHASATVVVAPAPSPRRATSPSLVRRARPKVVVSPQPVPLPQRLVSHRRIVRLPPG